ncbi:MAG: vanadium-dependent haloperoxidase [Ferruginibacter sp.]
MKKRIIYVSLLFATVLLFNLSCRKEKDQEPVYDHGQLNQVKSYSSGVVIKWLDMQLEMLRVPLPAGVGTQAAERALAYNGIVLYEAVVNGMPGYRSLGGQLTAFPVMPSTQPGRGYHWAACANAALAYINRSLFPAASALNKTKMDQLEDSLKNVFAAEVEATTLRRSIEYGRAVAKKVADWAATDGSANVNPPYNPPVGFGLWVPTAPTPPVNPYLSQRRLLVPGVKQGANIEPPPPYSTEVNSAFYKMAKDVYDKSLVLTPEQIAAAIYNRDAPGYPGGGHFISLLSQIFTQANLPLDVAALAYVKMGIASNDAICICFTKKYDLKVMRPITYIRNVMGFTTWNTQIPTPNHPEFPAAHAVNSSAISAALTNVLGSNFHFTLNTYEYLGLPARSYPSFSAMSEDMANSRVWGGIHYQASCDKGRVLGAKIGQNVLSILKFKKD